MGGFSGLGKDSVLIQIGTFGVKDHLTLMLQRTCESLTMCLCGRNGTIGLFKVLGDEAAAAGRYWSCFQHCAREVAKRPAMEASLDTERVANES